MFDRRIKKTTAPDGTVKYRLMGRLHNLSGPAIVYPDGTVEYWIDGVKISREAHERAREEAEPKARASKKRRAG